ncbi:glycosyltransferase family 2 protein [Lacinutrix iliipiscaria]|uniref:Glycosyltransferase family 2 protein n=1 Tax=Lacinutrix iliipiscaria TaxID=1230532 RepID=A0ABW5WRQ8_9FLAO
MKIAVVILNWNGKELLQKFLPSVISYSEEANIYVADNASTDASVAFVKTNFPQIKIIQNTQNGGYAQGYNEALKHLKEDVFCLLNSDIEVTPNWLKPIYAEFTTHKDTAIIQPKILDYKSKDHFEYAGAAGGFIDKYAYPYCRGRIFNTIEKDEGQYNDSSSIFWASGACFFIRKDVFQNLEGFDTSFFAHMEEIDLCWRAFNRDYQVRYVSQSSVYHVGGATLKSTNPKKTYLNFRNSLFTLTKNAPGPIFFLLLSRLALDGLAGIKFLLELKFGHFLAIFKAHFSFYSNLPKLLNTRKSNPKKNNYYNKTSIVWSYYIKGRKVF